MRRVDCASHITPVARSCSVAGLPALRRLLAQRMTALAPQSSNRAPSATRVDGKSKTIISQILAIIRHRFANLRLSVCSPQSSSNRESGTRARLIKPFRQKTLALDGHSIIKQCSTDGCAATHWSTAYTPHRTARVASSYVMTSDRERKGRRRGGSLDGHTLDAALPAT